MDYQRLLIDHLDLIDQIVRTTGRRRHLSAAEQDDFAGFVRIRLVENDYAILRKFQGRSSLWTYLAVVIERLSLDYSVAQLGRWRPSARAERLGSVAVLLERLTHRDGHTLEEAMELVRTAHGVRLTFPQLHALWNQLPPRPRILEVAEEAAAAMPASERSEDRVDEMARRQDLDRLERALRSALAGLPVQDRVILALRFDHGLSVSEIAGVMTSSAATVHRRIDRSLKDLRAALGGAGFEPREVAALIGHATVAMSPLLRAEIERFLKSVRLSQREG